MAKQIIKTNTVGLGCCCCFQKQETGYVFVLCFFPRCCLGMPLSLSPNCHWPPALSLRAPLHPPPPTSALWPPSFSTTRATAQPPGHRTEPCSEIWPLFSKKYQELPSESCPYARRHTFSLLL